MSEQSVDPQSYLSLATTVSHILLALPDGAKHGYAIMREHLVGVVDISRRKNVLGAAP